MPMVGNGRGIAFLQGRAAEALRDGGDAEDGSQASEKIYRPWMKGKASMLGRQRPR